VERPIYRAWYQNGVKAVQAGPTTTADSSHDLFRVWHDNGKVALEGTYVPSKGTSWLENPLAADDVELWCTIGNVTGTIARGTKDGIWRQWDRAGKLLGHYELDRGTGTEQLWFESGQLRSSSERLAGVEHGVVQHFHEHGSLSWECAYSEGKKHGTERKWHASGVLAFEGFYRNNLEHGSFRSFSEAGQLSVETAMQRGKRHGPHVEWVDGSKVVQGTFKNGKRHGLWVRWDEAGKESSRVTWIEGKHGNER